MAESLSEVSIRCSRALIALAARNMEVRARHKKTGHIYCVKGMCSNCTNGEHDGETMVIYRRESHCIDDPLFVRNVDEFLEKFEACD